MDKEDLNNDGSILSEEDFIYYLKQYGLDIERVEDRFEVQELKEDLSDDEIYKLVYKKVPAEYVGNSTLVKLLCKEYKIVNLINIIDMYVDYNDMSFKYGLVSFYNALNNKEETDETINDMIENFYLKPIIKLNNMFYLVRENK